MWPGLRVLCPHELSATGNPPPGRQAVRPSSDAAGAGRDQPATAGQSSDRPWSPPRSGRCPPARCPSRYASVRWASDGLLSPGEAGRLELSADVLKRPIRSSPVLYAASKVDAWPIPVTPALAPRRGPPTPRSGDHESGAEGHEVDLHGDAGRG